MALLQIIVDTREQKPFWTRNQPSKGYLVRRGTLSVGDYTTQVLLGKFHIERKSLQDLYGTLIHNHPRFRREIIRSEEKGIRLVVVVEGSHSDFINKKFPRGDQRKCTKETLKKIVATVRRRYDLEISFCKDRAKAISTVMRRLKREEYSLMRSTRR